MLFVSSDPCNIISCSNWLWVLIIPPPETWTWDHNKYSERRSRGKNWTQWFWRIKYQRATIWPLWNIRMMSEKNYFVMWDLSENTVTQLRFERLSRVTWSTQPGPRQRRWPLPRSTSGTHSATTALVSQHWDSLEKIRNVRKIFFIQALPVKLQKLSL